MDQITENHFNKLLEILQTHYRIIEEQQKAIESLRLQMDSITKILDGDLVPTLTLSTGVMTDHDQALVGLLKRVATLEDYLFSEKELST